MLKDNDFNRIERQVTGLYADLELSIIQEIALRIANVGYINTVSYNNIKDYYSGRSYNKNSVWKMCF